MATLNEILTKQAELIGAAKKTLETAQSNPPPTDAPFAWKEATVAELEARVSNLKLARDDAERQITEQIEAYQREIEALTDQR